MGERAKAMDGYRADSSPLLGEKRRGKEKIQGGKRQREREGEEKGGGRREGPEVKKRRYYSF